MVEKVSKEDMEPVVQDSPYSKIGGPVEGVKRVVKGDTSFNDRTSSVAFEIDPKSLEEAEIKYGMKEELDAEEAFSKKTKNNDKKADPATASLGAFPKPGARRNYGFLKDDSLDKKSRGQKRKIKRALKEMRAEFRSKKPKRERIDAENLPKEKVLKKWTDDALKNNKPSTPAGSVPQTLALEGKTPEQIAKIMAEKQASYRIGIEKAFERHADFLAPGSYISQPSPNNSKSPGGGEASS